MEKELELNEEAGKDVVLMNKNYPAANSETGLLLQMAVERNLDLDKLQQLIDMKNKEEDRAAKKEFDFHFSEMQKELVPVKRNKDGSKTDKGQVVFKYAPLEEIQRLNNPIISKHGFSYKWREERIEGSQEKRVRLIINGWGWSDEETYFDVPQIDTNRLTTAVQTRGMQSSYGKRYTFISGFGITVEGEDDERALVSEVLQYAKEAEKINACLTLPELQSVFGEFYKAATVEGKTILTKIYKEKKEQLNGTAN